MQDEIIKGYADFSFGQIHYRRVNGDGVPIVLLHRTPACSSSFDAMLRCMAGRRAAIALDTPGFGQSFMPEGMPETVSYARWFLAALAELGIDRFDLCAHHTGTHFAIEMAVLARERIRSLSLSGFMYASVAERFAMRKFIGAAEGIDPDGKHFVNAWKLMRGLFDDPLLVHREALGALAAIAGHDQAFGAILAQDFPAILARVTVPVAVIQPWDDPLDAMLPRLRAAHPTIPVRLIGHAALAAPERQPSAYANAAIDFADNPNEFTGTPMTDRRFELVRTPTGFDLAQAKAPRPEPGPSEVLVRVHAASVNRRDLSIRDLSYPVAEGADRFVPMSDAAGEVVAVGDGVTTTKPGDLVCSTFSQNWASGKITFPAVISALAAGGRGALTDYVVLNQHGVAPLPAGWSFEEGASFGCAGVTAWSALTTFGNVQPGDWVLTLGTGGVAIFALQIAVAKGAKVVVLSSSDSKRDRARALGASVTINYAKMPDWAEAVKAATGGGVRHTIELGGAGTLEQSLASMAIGGHVALIGALAGFGGDIPGEALVMAALRVSAVVVGSQADHHALASFMVEHRIRPVIDSVFDADTAQQAYARVNEGAFAKVVIRLAE